MRVIQTTSRVRVKAVRGDLSTVAGDNDLNNRTITVSMRTATAEISDANNARVLCTYFPQTLAQERCETDRGDLASVMIWRGARALSN